ncbi:MAG: nitrilase-related carbon-nitrogen hydrolase [Desulfobacterales bacterium]
MKDIRIAAVVCQSLVGEAEDNFHQMTKWVCVAKNSGVELICFPEMNITGYSIHKSILGHSEALTGTVVEKLSQLARLENIMILAGIAEKHENKKKVFASHLVIRSDGSWKNYRKLHIAPPEKDIFAAGNEIPVFSSRKVKFGIQLCYDAHFPELSTCMAMRGVDMIFMPHASPRGTPESKFRSWMRHLPARAFDNGVFVVACNQAGENGEDLKFPGLALVIGPDGKVVQKDVSGKEGLLIADLKSKDLDAVREHRMRYFLPNRRPELYTVK